MRRRRRKLVDMGGKNDLNRIKAPISGPKMFLAAKMSF